MIGAAAETDEQSLVEWLLQANCQHCQRRSPQEFASGINPVYQGVGWVPLSGCKPSFGAGDTAHGTGAVPPPPLTCSNCLVSSVISFFLFFVFIASPQTAVARCEQS